MYSVTTQQSFCGINGYQFPSSRPSTDQCYKKLKKTGYMYCTKMSGCMGSHFIHRQYWLTALSFCYLWYNISRIL